MCRASGWNQLATDWERLIEHEPTACFVIQHHEKIIGTVTTTCYGSQLAWIGMMLVHEEYRRQGMARALINTCLDHLQARKIRCIKLDATPTGKLVYSQLGFREEWSFHRWQRENNDRYDRNTMALSDFDPKSDTGWNLDLDQAAFGVARGQWLSRLANHSRVTRYREGCGMVREGHLASYVGPVIASSPETARRIIDQLLASTNRKIFWDIPQPNHNATALARDYGFQPVRTLTRMWTGLELTQCNLDLQYAIADPGTG